MGFNGSKTGFIGRFLLVPSVSTKKEQSMDFSTGVYTCDDTKFTNNEFKIKVKKEQVGKYSSILQVSEYNVETFIVKEVKGDVCPDASKIKSDDISKLVKDRDIIVYFNGNGELAQNMGADFCRLAKQKDSVVVGFNYPDVGNSTGKIKSPQDLIDSGYAVVKELIDKGADPSRIKLIGHSLGGAVATKVAKKLHDEGKKVYLLNDRSFGKLSKEIGHIVNNIRDVFSPKKTLKACANKNPLEVLLNIIKLPFVSLIRGILEFVNCTIVKMEKKKWEMDIVSDFKALFKAGYADLRVFRAPKKDKSLQKDPNVAALNRGGDGVIGHEASLYTALKKEIKEAVKGVIAKKDVEQNIKKINEFKGTFGIPKDGVNKGTNFDELLNTVRAELRKKRLMLTDEGKRPLQMRGIGLGNVGHNLPLDVLRTL